MGKAEMKGDSKVSFEIKSSHLHNAFHYHNHLTPKAPARLSNQCLLTAQFMTFCLGLLRSE